MNDVERDIEMYRWSSDIRNQLQPGIQPEHAASRAMDGAQFLRRKLELLEWMRRAWPNGIPVCHGTAHPFLAGVTRQRTGVGHGWTGD